MSDSSQESGSEDQSESQSNFSERDTQNEGSDEEEEVSEGASQSARSGENSEAETETEQSRPSSRTSYTESEREESEGEDRSDEEPSTNASSGARVGFVEHKSSEKDGKYTHQFMTTTPDGKNVSIQITIAPDGTVQSNVDVQGKRVATTGGKSGGGMSGADKRQNDAAADIQRMFRGHRARKRFQKLSSESGPPDPRKLQRMAENPKYKVFSKRHHSAARAIQRIWRGHRVRRKIFAIHSFLERRSGGSGGSSSRVRARNKDPPAWWFHNRTFIDFDSSDEHEEDPCDVVPFLTPLLASARPQPGFRAPPEEKKKSDDMQRPSSPVRIEKISLGPKMNVDLLTSSLDGLVLTARKR